MIKLNTDKKALRKFGFVMFGAFTVLQTFLWWKEAYTFWINYVSVTFLLFGLILPIALSPIEWVWMKLAHVMGFVMTRVILTITYIVAVVPTGLIFRLLGKDLLNTKLDKKADTYWIDAEADGPWTRPDKPY